MRDHRYGLCPGTPLWEGQFTTLFEVHHRVGVEVVDHTTIGSISKGERTTGVSIVVAPTFTTYATGREVVHPRFHPLITQVVVGTKGIDLIWCHLTEIGDEFGHFIDIAPEFIAQGKHPEGGMVTIGAQNVFPLFMQELHQYRVLIIEIAPEGEFWLKDDTILISSNESSLWWTPGVETHVVQTIGLTGVEVLPPSIEVHCHMSCQGPHTGIMSATQEDLMPIGKEMLPLDVEVLKVRMYLLGSLCSMKFCRKFDFTDDSVPIGLGILCIGMTVGIDLFWYATAIIHHNTQLMLTWFQHFREIKHLRGRDVVRCTNQFAVDIDF